MEVGQAVTWIYTPRGGYGWPIPVDGIVIAVTSKRVKVEVQKRSGEMVQRWVTPDRLKPR